MDSVELFYNAITKIMPDQIMSALFAVAAVAVVHRYQVSRNTNTWALIAALAWFSVYYLWCALSDPEPLARLAAGRVSAALVGAATVYWGFSNGQTARHS